MNSISEQLNDGRQFCACGCGVLAPLHSRTGQPCRYLQSHSSRTKRLGYVRHRINGESVQEHTTIVEAALGKPLPKHAQVHHVDGNKRNNAGSNLVVCQDQRYHSLLHYRAKVLKAGGDPNRDGVCGTCLAVKPLTDFNRQTARISNGRQSECRQCQKMRFKAWRLRNGPRRRGVLLEAPSEYRQRQEQRT
jgi:hypothetical protein